MVARKQGLEGAVVLPWKVEMLKSVSMLQKSPIYCRRESWDALNKDTNPALTVPQLPPNPKIIGFLQISRPTLAEVGWERMGASAHPCPTAPLSAVMTSTHPAEF